MRFAPSRRDLMAHAAGLSALASLGSLGACASTPGAPLAPPRATDVLGDLDATGVAACVRAGDFSATEAAEAAIARIERVNPRLHFIAASFYDEARARAAGRLSGPFAGAPTLIKDLTNYIGQPTRYGSRAFANNVSGAQAPYVDALMAAGLTPLGKSTTPEFGLTATTEPLLGGPTRNPWNPDHSTGGSSGGAAAAVASGAIPIAHASDGGGSIRIPASCCGLVGLKPSRGRTIITGPADPGISLSVNGCLSRSVRDTALWLAVTEQTGPGAILAPVGFVSGPSERRLRIGVAINDTFGRAPHADVAAVINATVVHCRGLGHDVREKALRFEAETFVADFQLLWAAGAADIVRQVQASAQGAPLDQLLEPLTLQLAEHYASAPQGALEQAIGRLRGIEAQYAALFSDIDLLLTPTLAAPPPAIGYLSPNQPFERSFGRLLDYAQYTPIQNVSGAPAISLPLGLSSERLPIGAQFSAPLGEERRLLELAYELELAAPWAARRPLVWAGA